MARTEDSTEGTSPRLDAHTGGLGSQASVGKGARRSAAASLCAFWIGERCFGLDTRLVGEVVTVEDHIQVPLAPRAVRGVFNLRGEPVPLVSLAAILNLPEPRQSQPKNLNAIVLRAYDVVVGLIADRMETVFSPGRNQMTPPSHSKEDAAYVGFIELVSDNIQTVVSVLDPEALLGLLSALRYIKATDG